LRLALAIDLEKNGHNGTRSGGLRAARGMLQDRVDLRSGDPGEPRNELLDRCSAFEILE
jgi:hypothetical protein